MRISHTRPEVIALRLPHKIANHKLRHIDLASYIRIPTAEKGRIAELVSRLTITAIIVILILSSIGAFIVLRTPGSGSSSSLSYTSSTSSSTSSTTSVQRSTTTSSTVSTSAEFLPPMFYIATAGNDSWSGTLSSPNAAHTDGPVATIARAQALVRNALKSGGPSPKTIAVEVEAGTYFLNSTLTFSSADSGTATTPVIYESAPGEKVVISGGRAVAGWTRLSGNEWGASATGLKYFEQLWRNNQPIFRPRTTGNGTYLYFVGPVYSSYRTSACSVQVGTQYECFDRFRFRSGDLAASYYDINNVEIDDFECWTVPRMRLSSVNLANDTAFTTGTTSPNSNCHGFIAGHRYLVENVKEALSKPGQWYFDQPSSKILYMAAPEEDPNTESFVAPQLSQLIVGDGLSYVTFQGLTFSGTSWVVPAKGWTSPQGEELSPTTYVPAALSFTGSSHITVTNCTLAHLGNYAISFVGTGQFQPTAQIRYNEQITNCDIYDTGSGGIVVGRPPAASDTNANVAQYVLIENDVITGTGRFLPGAYPVYILNSHDNTIAHNVIHDAYSNAISVGGTYGYNIKLPQLAHDNTVEYNLVYDINQGVAEDGGALYTASGVAQGNKILNNVAHDVTAYTNSSIHGYGGWGIYFDSTSQNVVAANNLVYRTSFPSIHQNDGFNNTVTNNILAFGNLGIIDRTHNNGSSLFVTHNIILWDISSSGSSFQRGIWTCTGTCSSQFAFSDNLYWYLGGTPSFITTNGNNPSPITHTFAQWQALGEDAGSTIGDPLFGGITFPDYNFTLRAGSPAFGVGFVPFDPTQAGLLPGVAITPPVTPAAFPLQLLNPSTGF